LTERKTDHDGKQHHARKDRRFALQNDRGARTRVRPPREDEFRRRGKVARKSGKVPPQGTLLG